MTLFEFINTTKNDYDTYDTVYDAVVTVCFIEEDKDNDSYDKFCNEIIKKVIVVSGNGCSLVVNWTELIKNNIEKFRAFTQENWRSDCQYEDDEDEFIYQWITEIHNYMAGNVSEDFYDTLIEFVESLS